MEELHSCLKYIRAGKGGEAGDGVRRRAAAPGSMVQNGTCGGRRLWGCWGAGGYALQIDAV